MPTTHRTITALAVALWAGPAHAADGPDSDTKTLPCRPTIACTADLVSPGAFELEAGYLFRRFGNTTRQWTFPFLAKLTLVKWAQLQVGSNGFTTSIGPAPTEYLDDITVGLKLHVHDQTAHSPSLSFSGSASIPTFDGQRGYLRTHDALFIAYVTKDFGPVHTDLNVGFNVWRLDTAALPQFFTALALSANLPPPFGIMAEAYYFSSALPVAPKDGGFLFAVTHSPRPWLMFDVGGDIGFFPSARSYSAFFGMSVVPALLWRTR